MSSRRRQLAEGLLILLGLGSVLGLALQFAGFALLHYPDSDTLGAQVLAADWLAHPSAVRGWTFGPAPYLFPDYLVMTGLVAACGVERALALHAGFAWTALAVLLGLSLRAATQRLFPALLAGILATHLLLALQWLPEHARILWWMGAPLFHGGTVLSTLAVFALVAGALRDNRLGTMRGCLLGLLCLAAQLSDALFLFQAMLPVLAALWWARNREEGSQVWRPILGIFAGALLGAMALKALLEATHWMHFSKVVRYPPTPANVWRAASRFGADVFGLVGATVWGFGLLAAASLHSLRSRTSGGDSGDFLRRAMLASLLIAAPLPFAAGYYKDPQSLRYWMNWAVLPAGLLALGVLARGRATPGPGSRKILLAGAVLIFSLAGGQAWLRLDPSRLEIPTRPEGAALADFVAREASPRGLADFWLVNELNASLRGRLELRQLDRQGRARFWHNNAQAYLGSDGRTWPAYTFILTNTLDENALRESFGEPARREQVGRYTVWLYDPAGQERIRARLEPQVREELRARRLE